jgi:phosphohistidine swiveling domain-containing protein
LASPAWSARTALRPKSKDLRPRVDLDMIRTGRARVIVDPVHAHVDPGEILVAPTTDPGWNPLFLTAAGLMTETGSPMAHGPAVAREYGIPAVICFRTRSRSTARRAPSCSRTPLKRIDPHPHAARRNG